MKKTMKNSTNYYRNTRPEVMAFIPKDIKTILDIGCGEGNFLKSVKDLTGAETWGVELVAEVANNKKNDINNLLIGKIEDVLSQIPDSYFDCITFNDVLEHLIDPTLILINIKPKLKDNGLILASIPNVRFIYNLFELIVKKDWEYKNQGILDYTHFRFFTQKSMRRMFQNAGYVVIKQKGINKTSAFKLKLFNILTLGFFADTLYQQFVCISSKNTQI
jgi:2-polyprenyl-3-methyl-5-hydroxy-6-metoxy-1,4-benzoquinol methylase